MNDRSVAALGALDLFKERWALVTAGTMDDHNACTVGWGSLGTLWGRRTVTVYVYPSRRTFDYLRARDTFTVSFFPPAFKKALGVMGTLSGRDGDKEAAAGLTPVPFGESVTFREAGITLLCRKLYQHAFFKEDLAPEIADYYKASPKVFPPDGNGEWRAHWAFVGEVTEIREA